MITSTSTSVFPPDPREAALTRARAMFPAAPIADVIAVAEYLLRPVPAPAPVYPAGGWAPPYQVTCSSPADVITTNLPPSEYVIAPGGRGAGGAGRATVFGIDRRPDDDGTAGVLAKVG